MKKIVTIVAVMSTCFATGCSHITMLRVQELKQVESRVDSLRVEMVALQEQLLKEQKISGELLRLIRADQQVKLGEISQQMASLENSISESSSRLTKIDMKTGEIQKKVEEKAKGDSLERSSKTAEIEKIFSIAYGDFTRGKYDLAIRGFEDFYQQYPLATQAEEAKYWIAECMYAKKDFDKAEKGYFDYIKNYPSGKKMCVTLYKLGLIYDVQKSTKKREAAWAKLLSSCPDAEESAAVKSILSGAEKPVAPGTDGRAKY